MYIFLLPLAIVILLALPVISRIKHFTDGTKCKNAIIGNICSFFGVMLLAVLLPMGSFVSAEVVEETAGVISSAGMGYLAYAVLFTLIMCVIVLVLKLIGKNGGERSLVIVIPEDLNYSKLFDDLFEKYTTMHRLKEVRTTNMGSLFKLRYVICLKDASREKEFIDELRCRNGNLEILISEKEDSVNEL